ncbi:MAG: DUF2088 domain-containing protein, partial [Bacteroidales bacterium]
RAGEITELVWEYFGERLYGILPALGTHSPLSPKEISYMFGRIPEDLFVVHDWRNDVVTLGTVPSEFISNVSGGKVNFEWQAQVNKILVRRDFDLILSIGQVVPHEVTGMANYNKNLFVGTGGAEGINKSHFLGAVYGMERIMGRADTPVRKVLNYASNNLLQHLPKVVYVLTVIDREKNGNLVVRGLFIGDDAECFYQASNLSRKVNIDILGEPVKKAVVYLDPLEYKSTWLGNKAIYRTRMAMADGGELIILAPGVKVFGEDPEIDRLIRKFGYCGTPAILDAVDNNPELRNNLSAAAHLIHGSSEDRFAITYCPGEITKDEIQAVHFKYAPIEKMLKIYNTSELRDGYNILPDGEEIFFISNPSLGLWATKNKFSDTSS